MTCNAYVFKSLNLREINSRPADEQHKGSILWGVEVLFFSLGCQRYWLAVEKSRFRKFGQLPEIHPVPADSDLPGSWTSIAFSRSVHREAAILGVSRT
jgi:hypothetical protein